jgi:hypothetical protein
LVTRIDHPDHTTPGPWRLLPADMDRHGQTITLDGHVHLAFASLSAEAASPPTTIVDTNRAILVGHPDGTTAVQVDEATVQTAFPPLYVSTRNYCPST